MADIPISGKLGASGPESNRIGGVPAKGTGSKVETKEQGVAFRALLEKLEEKARVLEEQTRGVDDAKNLAGAVEGAKASLDDALSLGEELLETYRQNRQQNSAGTEEQSK